MNIHFNKSQLSRMIKTQGKGYSFIATGENEFGEPIDPLPPVVVNGVYHETQGYVNLVVTEGAMVRSKPQSLIMCMVEDTKDLTKGMQVTISGKVYKLVDIRNINNLEFAADLSLEVVV